MNRFQFSVSIFGGATRQQAFGAAHDWVTVCASQEIADRVRFVEVELDCDDIEEGWEEWIVTCQGRAADRAAIV